MITATADDRARSRWKQRECPERDHVIAWTRALNKLAASVLVGSDHQLRKATPQSGESIHHPLTRNVGSRGRILPI